MNIKTFTIIAIASFAVLSVTACGGKQKASIETEQTEETSKTEVIVSDNKLFINSDLYNMSEEKVIFNAHGRLDPDNPSFGTDHIDHYRTLFVKENGGLTVGYVVKTTRGITLQTGKTFYFYNDLCLKERTRDLYNIVGMVKNNGVLIPMKITIDGEGLSRFLAGIIFYTREVLLTSHYEKRLFEYASQPRVACADIRLLSYLWSRTNLSRDSYQSG